MMILTSKKANFNILIFSNFCILEYLLIYTTKWPKYQKLGKLLSLFIMENLDNQNVVAILEYFGWNWDLAADHLQCDPKVLYEEFSKYQTKRPNVLTTQSAFAAGHISKESVKRAQMFINEHLADQLPLLFKKDLTDEQKHEMAQAILVDKGLTFRLLHAPEFIDAYNALEEEALQLEKWREQGQYLNILEDALYRIVASHYHREKNQE